MKSTIEPVLLPILRSRGQAELLCAVVANPKREWTLADLAQVSGQSLPTVQREVERAETAQILVSRRVGRSRLVSAGPSPLVAPLAELLLMSYGPRFVIAEKFAGVKGIERLFIFGSWAARYQGIEGNPPTDIDVLVIGNADFADVVTASVAASKKLKIDVNPTIQSHTWWKASSGSGFREEIRRRPLVEIEVRGDKKSAVKTKRPRARRKA